jgi:hypothetical protein
MRTILMGATLCAVAAMALPVQAEPVKSVAVEKSRVQIEVRRAQDEDGPDRMATRLPEPTTTGSAGGGPALGASNVPECQVFTVRSPQPNGTTVIRKLRQCF